MSNYTKATNFATKDALTSGNPLKTLSGTELDDEFNAIQTASATKANIASAQLTGIPVAPTAASGTSTTQLATTAFVTAVDVLKAPLASPALTGVPVAPTAAADTNTTQLATTAFVTTEANLKADLAGAAFTGAITTTSTFDGRDVAADGVTADAALPKAGGAMTGNITGLTALDVAGTVTADGLVVDGQLDIESGASLGSGLNVNRTGHPSYGVITGGTDSVYHTIKPNGGSHKTYMKVSDDNDISFYEDTGTTAKFFWDASAERLNIGALYLGEIASGWDKIHSTGANGFRLQTSGGDTYFDSSGNVLVGKTSADSGAVGFQVLSSGKIAATVSGAESARFVRNGSDGEIVRLVKDGTSVGSIVAYFGDMKIGTGDTGVVFGDGQDAIYPAPVSTGGSRDAAIDLGLSTARFKDLYLSGGVYLGGTGAANKLDDYEEGTWTPAIDGGTLTITSVGTATYTKIGRSVTVQCFLTLNNNGSSDYLVFSGLPFNGVTNQYYTGVFTHEAGADTASTMYVRSNGPSTNVLVYKGDATQVTQTDADGSWIIFSLTYQTDA